MRGIGKGRLKRSAVFLLNLVIGALVLLTAVRYWPRSSDSPSYIGARALVRGSIITLRSSSQRASGSTDLLIALNSKCPVCNSSAGLLRELGERSENAGWRVLLLIDPSDKGAPNWVEDQGLGKLPRWTVPFQELGVWGTPTYLIVDDSGRITDFLTGGLSARTEQRLFERLAGLATEPLENVTVPATVSSEELARMELESKAQLVDVRNNTEFARNHRDRAMNIPFGDLGVLAPRRLDRSRTVILDGSGGWEGQCILAATLLVKMGFVDVRMVVS